MKTREKIRAWLTEKSVGEQILDSRPFVVYRSVQLNKAISGKAYPVKYDVLGNDLYNGTFTIEFILYEPYGYLLYKSYDGFDKDNAESYCGILPTSEMPAAITTSSRNFFMYNPGTEVCDTLIKIGGTVGSGGLTIQNETNGTKCKLLSLPSSGYLEIDSFHGSVVHVNGNTKTQDFQNHDEGFLKLEPSMLEKDMTIGITRNSNIASVFDYPVTNSLVGRYVNINNSWVKITGINSDGRLVLESSSSSTGSISTKLATINKITVTGTNISLSTFEIDYYPMIV